MDFKQKEDNQRKSYNVVIPQFMRDTTCLELL